MAADVLFGTVILIWNDAISGVSMCLQHRQLCQHSLQSDGNPRHRLGYGQPYEFLFICNIVDYTYNIGHLHSVGDNPYGGDNLGRVEHVHVEMHNDT